LKDWINFGIYWKIYFCILGLGLGSVALALHVSGLGLGLLALALTPLALLTCLVHTETVVLYKTDTDHSHVSEHGLMGGQRDEQSGRQVVHQWNSGAVSRRRHVRND